MKKYLSVLVIMNLVPMMAFANSNDYMPYVQLDPVSNQVVIRTTKPQSQKKDCSKCKAKSVAGYYMGLDADLSFLTWKNKYKGTESGSDSFNFKPLLGVDLVAGYRMNEKWRFDGELGYIGKYSESETEHYSLTEKTEFNLETYYLTANAYYDIAYGLYAGMGLGLAIVDLSADNTMVAKRSSTNLSVMGTGTFGWIYKLDEKVDLDIHYRLGFYDAGDMKIGGVKIDSGWVWNNALSVGLKYHF